MIAVLGSGARTALLIIVAGIAVESAGCGDHAATTSGDVSPAASPAAAAAKPLQSEAAPSAPAPTPAPVVEHVPPAAEQPGVDPSAACLAKTGGGAAPSSEIHRWVDASGITHYSDHAPTDAVSGHRVLEVRGVPPVKIEASGFDVTLPSDLERRAIVDAVAVQHIFHDALGIEAPPETALKIVFVGDAAAYARLVGDGTLAASTGAYVPQQHTIYVRMQADDELSFSILRHEITHALIHEEIGSLPVTLNEGLAEYFRRYRAAGMGGAIDISADRGALVKAAPAGTGSDALIELLALSGADFYAADRDRRYLQAYALIAVLMQSAERTAALHEVLAAQRAAPCAPVAAEQMLDAHYPGGLSALAADWSLFMRDPPISVRTY